KVMAGRLRGMNIESGATDRRIRVALVVGGRSGEHEVSCATAAGVMRALDPDRYEIVPVGITTDGRWVEGPSDPDALDLAAHGEITTGAEVLLRLDVGRELVAGSGHSANDDNVAGSGADENVAGSEPGAGATGSAD